MAAPVYKTKGELRAELLVKLGYGGLGAAAGNFVPMADGLLEEAQEQLYVLMPDEKRIREWQLVTGVDQRWYDFPPDCDPDRILNISSYFGQQWLKMQRGINISHDSIIQYINYYPQRYDFRARESIPVELLTNGDFAVSDTTVNGGLAGWYWTASNWKIENGVAEKLTTPIGYLQSGFSPIAGRTYNLTYTVDVAALNHVSIGGVTADVNGDAIPAVVGTHKVSVLPVNAGVLQFASVNIGSTVDNVSLSELGDELAPVALEFWPVSSDTQYPYKIEGYITMMPFVSDSDRATIDDRLILLYAEAFGLAHLNKPSAQVKMQALNKRLNILRGQQHGEQRYVRGREAEDVPPRPIVIP